MLSSGASTKFQHLSFLKATGDRHPVVLDIGSAYTKAGFASEMAPHAIIPSVVEDWETGLGGPVVDYARPPDRQRQFFRKFLYKIYYEHLLVAPKDRRVVIVESLLTPTAYRNLLAAVLFQDYDVPSILFAPSHLLATFPLGVESALVVDVGHREALAVPVFDSVTMLSAWEASPGPGAASLHSRLRTLLLRDAQLRPRGGEEKSLGQDPDALPQPALEDIKVKACFATRLERGRAIQAAEATKWTETGSLPRPPPPIDYPLGPDTSLAITGLAREAAAEGAFKFDGAGDDKSLPQLILDCLLRVPVDLRLHLAGKILVMGGGAMLPGLMSRLKSELKELVGTEYAGRLFVGQEKEEAKRSAFRFFPLRSKENYAAWLGGSLFGALEILPHRSVSREEFLSRPHIPDWCSQDIDSEESPQLSASKIR